jgi:diacylglycerol kinase family enzyme
VAARLLGRAIGSAIVGGSLARQLTRRFQARVTVDGLTWARDDFLTVAAACVEQIGLGFRPWYRAAEPGTFHILGIHAPTPLSIIAELPRIRRGAPMRRHKVIDQVAREAIFEADEIEYIVDGDTYKVPGRLRVAAGPKLRFIRLTGQAVSDAMESLGARTLDEPEPPRQLPA